MNRDHRHRAIEKSEHVEKSAGNVLGHNDRGVVKLRATLSLDVPILDRSHEMGLIGCAELDLHFVTARKGEFCRGEP